MPERPRPASIPITPGAPAPLVSLSDDNSRVIATLPAGDRVEVLLHGATVLSWKNGHGHENLWLSQKAILDGTKAVRGGIPVVFPAFGPPETGHATGQLPQHGFARNVRWEYLGKNTEESGVVPGTSGDASVKLDFGLSNSMLDEGTRKKWPHAFGLTYSVTLSPGELQTTIVVRNTGEEAWEFKTLLHSYFGVEDIAHATVSGLEKVPFLERAGGASKVSEAANEPVKIGQETDRIYANANAPVITIAQNGTATHEVRREEGLTDVVVWNPWSQVVAGMGDFEPKDGYKKMVCVEAGSVEKWTKLEGGESWEGGQRVRSVTQ